MRSLSFLLSILIVPSAHASVACRAVFSESATLVSQLAHLRTEINTRAASGERDLAKILYTNFRTKLREAQSMGIDTSSLMKQVAETTEHTTTKQNQESVRAERARKSEQRELMNWTLTHEISGAAKGEHYHVSASPNADRVAFAASPGRDRTVRIKSLTGSGETSEISPTRGGVFDFQINWTLGLVAIRGHDSGSFISVYSLATEQMLWTMPGEAMALNEKTSTIVVANEFKISLIDARTGQVIRHLTENLLNRINPQDLQVSADGERVSAIASMHARIFDLKTQGETQMYFEPTWKLALAPNSNLVALSRADKQIHFIDPATEVEVAHLPNVTSLQNMQYSPSGDKLTYTTWDKQIHVISTNELTTLRTFSESHQVRNTAFSEEASAFAYVVGGVVKVYQPAENAR